MGTPAGTIAAVTGLSERYVNRLLSGEGGGDRFQKLREDYKEKHLKTLVGSHFKLADLVPQSLEAFESALAGPDLRLRKETAQWIWDTVVPNLNPKDSGNGAQSDHWQITINQPHVQTAIGESMASVAKSLTGLQEAILTQDPDAHTKVGTDALTISPTQLEVDGGEGEVELTPTEDPKSDLLTELVEREE
jgi:hypothetical protein